jgi:DNA primase
MSIVQLIKQKLSIEQALKYYTNANLGKVSSRRSISIRCPFHDDRSPSFSFKPEENVWRCWSGCGGGDVISLVAVARGVSNGESINILKEDLGLSKMDRAIIQPINQEVIKKSREKEILENYRKRLDSAFHSLLKFEKKLMDDSLGRSKVHEDKNAEALNLLPIIGYWLDEMVEGDFESQVQVVLYTEKFLGRLVH